MQKEVDFKTSIMYYILMHLVRVFRQQRKMTMKQLADMAGVSDRMIYNIEHDSAYNIKRDTMIRISGALSLPVSIIFFPNEEMDKRSCYTDQGDSRNWGRAAGFAQRLQAFHETPYRSAADEEA